MKGHRQTTKADDGEEPSPPKRMQSGGVEERNSGANMKESEEAADEAD